MPDDDMGQGHAGVDPNGKSITNKTLDAASTSQKQTRKQTMQNMLDLLQQEVKNEK